jgi:hypothetical protein
MENAPGKIARLAGYRAPLAAAECIDRTLAIGNRSVGARREVRGADGGQHRLHELKLQRGSDEIDAGYRGHARQLAKVVGARAGFAPAIKNASNIAANNFLCDQGIECESGPFMTDDASTQRKLVRGSCELRL